MNSYMETFSDEQLAQRFATYSEMLRSEHTTRVKSAIIDGLAVVVREMNRREETA